MALVLLTAVPGVAIASLPAQPPPTHACCMAPEGMPDSGGCETAPCCVQKPAPRAPSVLTGVPVVVPAVETPLLACAAPAVPPASPSRAAIVPRARSAPLFLLLVTFLN
jgi:hypothetical protein